MQNENLPLEIVQLLEAAQVVSWDRGYASGFADAMRLMIDERANQSHANPYRTT